MAERKERGRTPSPASQRGHADDRSDYGGKASHYGRGKEGRGRAGQGRGGHKHHEQKRTLHQRGLEQRSRTQSGNGNGNYGNGSAQLQLPKSRSSMWTGPKKAGSLNHLLNFTVAREGHGGEGLDDSVGRLAMGTKQRSRRATIYNKEQFLQANCQFVVDNGGDYSIHTVESDALVSWDLVEQVRLLSHDVSSCPICLQPPRAAKITRCGHVYCWSCILHYLDLDDKTWRKCPICYEAVHGKDLKSVKVIHTRLYSANEKITMRLVRKEKTSSLLQPMGLGLKDPTLCHIGDEYSHFSKLLLASKNDVLSMIVEPEEETLRQQLSRLSPDEMSEKVYIQSAIDLLTEHAEKLQQATHHEKTALAVADSPTEQVSPSPVSSPASVQSTPVSFRFQLAPGVKRETVFEGRPVWSDSDNEEEECEGAGEEADLVKDSSRTKNCHVGNGDEELKTECSASQGGLTVEVLSEAVDSLSVDNAQCSVNSMSAEGNESSTPSSPLEDEERPVSANLQSKAQACSDSTSLEAHYFYFYQADDGQHIYLHPFTARCLMKEYSSLQFCPETITARIVEMESFSQSETSRKRYRHLSHLPLMCEFSLCQLDLQPPLLSRETLEYFADEIHRRQQKRLRKQREERREQLREIRRDKNTRKGQVFTHSMTQFPLCGNTQETALDESFIPEQEEAVLAEGTSDVSESGLPSHDSSQFSPPSFAQALRSSEKKAETVVRSVWKPVEKFVDRPAIGHEENDEDSYVPSFQEAFSDSLTQALSSASAGQVSAEVGKKGKKGRKKQVLFSTGMPHFR